MEKILIIDDQKQTKRILGNILTKTGYEVIYASSSKQALHIIESNDLNIDLLILDVIMPGIAGIDVAKKIREKYTSFELPILFASKQIGSQTIGLLYEAGGSDFISIPYMQVELIRRVRNLLDTKRFYFESQNYKQEMEIQLKVFKMNTHDLKNPLSSIFSLSGMLSSAFADMEEIQQTLNIIHNSSKFMLSLVNETLDYVKISTCDVQYEEDVIGVTQLVNQIVEVNLPLAKVKKQHIHFKYPENECYIVADNVKIFRAINNIVSNAIKFSPLGKNIWIDIIEDTDNNKVLIEVKDEGPGFKKDELSRVFNENSQYSAKPTGNEISTGLGLMITKLIVTQSKGEISLSSVEGIGSVFTISFNVYAHIR